VPQDTLVGRLLDGGASSAEQHLTERKSMSVLEGEPIVTVSTAIEPPLSEAAAEAWIPRTCFKNGPPTQVGVELELLVVDAHRSAGPARHYPHHGYPRLLNAMATGGLDGRLTVEPGGQVELSSRPGPDLAHTIDVVRRDLAALRRRAGRCGARLVGLGVDPLRPARRIGSDPRYAAMDHYFRPWGAAGQIMMCSTASVQVNVEAAVGDRASLPDDQARHPVAPLADLTARWDLLHAIGPALVAAFANSPLRAGRRTGWKSTRQGAWLALDPERTGVPPVRSGEDIRSAYARWALDAPLMLVRRPEGPWTAPRGLTFRDWVRTGRSAIPDLPPPTTDDLAYHLTTLFPQVRARGHLEVRYIDAQPDHWWTVPPAVITALLDDAAAAQLARAACEPTEGRWRDAARSGLADPALAAAAAQVMEIAAAALRRRPANTTIAGDVEGYLERWTARRRCPADDNSDSAPLAGAPSTDAADTTCATDAAGSITTGEGRE
jgi:glutamate--cysteine ligase